MTLETAKAILRTIPREASQPSQLNHTDMERAAFERRMARLRPRSFLRTVMSSR